MRPVSLMIVIAACGQPRASAPPVRGKLAITNVRVFDDTKVIPRATVVVDGDKIAAVGEASVPAGAEVMDGAGKDVTAIVVAAVAPGAFAFAIDDVALE